MFENIPKMRKKIIKLGFKTVFPHDLFSNSKHEIRFEINKQFYVLPFFRSEVNYTDLKHTSKSLSLALSWYSIFFVCLFVCLAPCLKSWFNATFFYYFLFSPFSFIRDTLVRKERENNNSRHLKFQLFFCCPRGELDLKWVEKRPFHCGPILLLVLLSEIIL